MSEQPIIVGNGHLSLEAIQTTLRWISMRVLIVKQVQDALSEGAIPVGLARKVLQTLELEQKKHVKESKRPSPDIARLAQIWSTCQ